MTRLVPFLANPMVFLFRVEYMNMSKLLTIPSLIELHCMLIPDFSATVCR